MPYTQYDFETKPSKRTLEVVDLANEIIAEYEKQGFDLTLRQLYYQFVSRDYIPNSQSEYNKLGTAVNTGRMVGLIDWDAIIDRTRFVRQLNTYRSPRHIITNCVDWYRENRWQMQTTNVEVWIEKDALVGVIENMCNKWRVPFFSCRGYVSQSEMWGMAQRIQEKSCDNFILLHLGDHDPSGIDMTRDISERISNFLEVDGANTSFEVKRIALNMDQIREYNPPPNPAKSTDSRFCDYARLHGNSSWELDALEPSLLASLIDDEIRAVINFDQWYEDKEQEECSRQKIREIAEKI